jgi:hypothetical protein
MLRSAEHLVHKHGIRLFLWEKHRTDVARQEDLTARFREIRGSEKQYVLLPGLGHTALIERNRHLLTHALLTSLEAPRPAW